MLRSNHNNLKTAIFTTWDLEFVTSDLRRGPGNLKEVSPYSLSPHTEQFASFS